MHTQDDNLPGSLRPLPPMEDIDPNASVRLSALEQAPPGYDSTAPRPGSAVFDPALEQAGPGYDPEAPRPPQGPAALALADALALGPPGYDPQAPKPSVPSATEALLELAPPGYESAARCPQDEADLTAESNEREAASPCFSFDRPSRPGYARRRSHSHTRPQHAR